MTAVLPKIIRLLYYILNLSAQERDHINELNKFTIIECSFRQVQAGTHDRGDITRPQFKRWIVLTVVQITIQWKAQLVSLVIHWRAICPFDGAIHFLDNRSKVNNLLARLI